LFASFAFLVLNLTVLQSAADPTGTLTLAWDPSGDTNVAGYRLYEGTASETYTNVLDVGTNLTATLSGLAGGQTYYLALTAYDITGLESEFSGQIIYEVPVSTPPVPAHLVISKDASNQAVLTGTAPAGYVYDVCASMDFESWLVIGTVTADPSGGLLFTDAPSSALPWRYYRLKQTNP
jgi:hypothetical protein